MCSRANDSKAFMSGKRYSDEEEKVILSATYNRDMCDIAHLTGRTTQAVKKHNGRAGLRAISKVLMSLNSAISHTGYSRRQFLRGVRLSGVKPLIYDPDAKKRIRLFTEDQIAKVVAALGAETARALAEPTTYSLAKEAGVSIRTVQRAVKRLGVECRRELGRSVLVAPSDAERVLQAVLRTPEERSASARKAALARWSP